MGERINVSFFSKIILTLILIIASITLHNPVFAIEKTVITLSASYSAGDVSVSGTTSQDVLAVAVMLYDTDGSTLLRMETFPVTDQSFSANINISLSAGTYTVKAADYNGGPYASTVFTHTSAKNKKKSSNSSSSSGTTADLSESSTPPIPIAVDTTSGKGTARLEETKAAALFSASGVIKMPSIPDVHSYTLEMPATFLTNTQSQDIGQLTISTDAASIVIPANMLASLQLPDAENIQAAIGIGQADKAKLTEEEKTAIGNRPLIELTLSLYGKTSNWNNLNAPVSVSIPYHPTEEELKNPDSIIIWYLDGNGNLTCIPNGRYNPISDEVTFATTHFSLYAVGYRPITFHDVAPEAWYNKAVSFIAARNITAGTGDGNFSPEKQLTRGELLVLLMRTYDITPDLNPTDNFADAGNTYYTGYLAAAKRLGIANGFGNNLFAPAKNITRQEMFTLLYNALKIIEMLPGNNGNNDNGKTLLSFSDANDIAPWAKEAMTFLVETGTIGGSNGMLYPTNTTTRAEIAQVLYNLIEPGLSDPVASNPVLQDNHRLKPLPLLQPLLAMPCQIQDESYR